MISYGFYVREVIHRYVIHSSDLSSDNIRYAFDNCIFGFPDANGIPSTPCSTSTACGALEAALTGDDLKPNNLDYSYCDVDGSIMTSPMVEKCMSCVGATGDKAYLVNCKSEIPASHITQGLTCSFCRPCCPGGRL